MSAAAAKRASPSRSDGDALDGIAIYDGQMHQGDIFDLGCRVAAQLADGTILGPFASIASARHAILVAARSRS